MLESRARTIEHMRLINALCRFAEMAGKDDPDVMYAGMSPFGFVFAGLTAGAAVTPGALACGGHSRRYRGGLLR